MIAYEFKVRFSPNLPSEEIDALHQRVADRLHWVCTKNAGCWIKFGQAIGLQAMLLPKPYRVAFAGIFDHAPMISYDEVDQVFRREFGVSPDEAFDTFDHEAIASASIAQVHKATRKDEHGVVRTYAVKIQRPAIRKQLAFDLWGYRTLLTIFQYTFDVPIAFIGPYVSSQIAKEADFKLEARNSERSAELIAHEPSLRGKVYVPPVDWKYTSERVMTAEFVDAVKLTDAEALDRLKLGYKETMDIALNMTSAMIFKWGFMHSDCHPGNVLVRPHPDRQRQPQIVLIDHGLYVELSEKFRQEYCRFWRSLVRVVRRRAD